MVSQSGDQSQNDFQNFEDRAENIIKKCADEIRLLKETANGQIFPSQYRQNLENVFFILEKYFKGFNFKFLQICFFLNIDCIYSRIFFKANLV